MLVYRFDLNIEPIFAMVSLYDAKEKKKISESFHLDCNPSDIQHMLDDHFEEKSMASLSRSGIFNVTYPNSDVFLIIKVSLHPPTHILTHTYTHTYTHTHIHTHTHTYTHIHIIYTWTNFLCPSLFVMLTVQIEKVLQQGDISDAAEPYLKARDLDKKAIEKHKLNANFFCHQLGKYRMPFAWTAINVLELLAGNQVCELL